TSVRCHGIVKRKTPSASPEGVVMRGIYSASPHHRQPNNPRLAGRRARAAGATRARCSWRRGHGCRGLGFAAADLLRRRGAVRRADARAAPRALAVRSAGAAGQHGRRLATCLETIAERAGLGVAGQREKADCGNRGPDSRFVRPVRIRAVFRLAAAKPVMALAPTAPLIAESVLDAASPAPEQPHCDDRENGQSRKEHIHNLSSWNWIHLGLATASSCRTSLSLNVCSPNIAVFTRSEVAESVPRITEPSTWTESTVGCWSALPGTRISSHETLSFARLAISASACLLAFSSAG